MKRTPGPRKRAEAMVRLSKNGELFAVFLDQLLITTQPEPGAKLIADAVRFTLTRYGRACARTRERAVLRRVVDRLRRQGYAEVTKQAEAGLFYAANIVAEMAAAPKPRRRKGA